MTSYYITTMMCQQVYAFTASYINILNGAIADQI